MTVTEHVDALMAKGFPLDKAERIALTEQHGGDPFVRYLDKLRKTIDEERNATMAQSSYSQR